jgi:hypothetical protein
LSTIPNDYFNNCAIMITSGLSKGHISSITDYSSSLTRLSVLVGPAAAVAGDTIKIGPEVILQNDTRGTRFKGIAETNTRGNITHISVGNIGSGYSNTWLTANISYRWDAETNVPFSANGSGAYANVSLPPSSGHGYDACEELNAKYVIINGSTPVGGSTADALTPDYGMDYQQMGLLRNPIDPLTSTVAVGSAYDLRTHIMFRDQYGHAVGDVSTTPYNILAEHFPADTNIINANNQSKATVWKVGGVGPNKIPVLSLVNTEGTFANGQYIQNSAGRAEQIWTIRSYASSGMIRGKETQNTVAVYTEQLTKYTGDIIYLENIRAVTRYIDQYETFKVVLEF